MSPWLILLIAVPTAVGLFFGGMGLGWLFDKIKGAWR